MAFSAEAYAMRTLILVVLVFASSPILCTHGEVPAAMISSLAQHFHAKCILFLQNTHAHRDAHLLEDFYTVLLRKSISLTFSARAGSLQSVKELDEKSRLSLPLYIASCWNPKTCLSLFQVPLHVKASFGRWLIILQHNASLHELLTNFYIPFDCEFLVAEMSTSNSTILIKEVYHIAQGLPLQIHNFGIWSSQTENPKWPNINLYKRRTNLNGHVIKAATLIDGVYISLDKKQYSPSPRIYFGGYIGSIWELLEQMMNFRSEYQVSLDGGTGSQLSNGTWNGLMGMLQRNEAEVGAASFLMTQNRLDVIDYFTPLAEAGNNLYVRPNGVYSLPWRSFLAPFHSTVWLCILLSIFTLSLMLAVTHEVGHHYHSPAFDSLGPSNFTYHDAWLYILGTFCQQGHDDTTGSAPCRIVYITSYICAMVILAGYSGIYVSFLTSERTLVLPFNTFEELLKDGSYKLGVSPRSAQLNFFNKATDPILQEIYKKLIDEHQLPPTYEEGFQKVCNSKYVFMTSEPFKCRSLYSVTCQIVALSGAYFPGFVSMTVIKDSPYRGLINYNLERMQEVAILQRIREHSQLKKGCLNSSQSQDTALESRKAWDSISLGEVLPTICMFAIGVVISMMLLVIECWMKYRDKIKCSL